MEKPKEDWKDLKIKVNKTNPEEEQEEDDSVSGLFSQFIGKKLSGSKKRFAEVE